MARDQSCETLTILMARSHADLEVYCEAVARLSHRDGTPFDELYALSERARRARFGASSACAAAPKFRSA